MLMLFTLFYRRYRQLILLCLLGSLLLESKISPNTAYQKQQVSPMRYVPMETWAGLSAYPLLHLFVLLHGC